MNSKITKVMLLISVTVIIGVLLKTNNNSIQTVVDDEITNTIVTSKSNNIENLDILTSTNYLDNVSSFVEYIKEEYGLDKINEWIITPYEYRKIFGISEENLYKEWSEHSDENYIE